MGSVMKMNDRLGMSKAADVDILLPSDRNLPAGKNTRSEEGERRQWHLLLLSGVGYFEWSWPVA
jgi:hypothetical protein